MSKFTSQAKIIVLALFLALGISYASAASVWTGPSATPPGDNVDVPVNVGNNAQSKTGDLSVGAFLANYNSQFLGSVSIGATSPSNSYGLLVTGKPIKAQGGFVVETVAQDPASPETGRMWLINQ